MSPVSGQGRPVAYPFNGFAEDYQAKDRMREDSQRSCRPLITHKDAFLGKEQKETRSGDIDMHNEMASLQ